METNRHLDDDAIERLVDDAMRRGASHRLERHLNRRYRRRLWAGYVAGTLMVLLVSTTAALLFIPTHYANYRLEGYTLQEAMDQNYYMLTNK